MDGPNTHLSISRGSNNYYLKNVISPEITFKSVQGVLGCYGDLAASFCILICIFLPSLLWFRKFQSFSPSTLMATLSGAQPIYTIQP